MKKSSIYTIVVAAFLLAVGGIILKYRLDKNKTDPAYYSLQQRNGALAATAEWVSTRNNAEALLIKIRNNEADVKSMLGLTALFIREARITGNHMYYDMAALKYVNKVLAIDSANFEALIYKSIVQLSQHHFADALQTAEKARRINPYNAFVYGILVDGNVEMGYYDSAVANSDRMVSIRPDIRSYSRISYLREIYGDYPGAKEAMKMAVEAGIPGDEATEWARIQLGHLYENTGDLQNAEKQYLTALGELNAYAYALAGLGRLAMGRKDYAAAIRYFQQADSSINDYSFKEQMADAYALGNDKPMAERLMREVIENMSKDAQQGDKDANIGHYADRELAYAYLKINEYDDALRHALLEYNRRPQNIDVNEAVAWAYYKKGDMAKAQAHIKEALKTNSKNPVLLCRAGLISYKNGDSAMAKSLLQQVFQNQPNIEEPLRTEASQILQTIK